MTILGSIDIQFTDASNFTWIVYADDAQGTNLTTSPIDKAYMGIAYNQTSEEYSTDPLVYAWSKVMGEGIVGPPGADGQTLYTWIKYGTSSAGDGLNDSPVGMTYIGIAYNQTSQNESNDPTKYQWSLIKGDTGATGPQGPKGDTGAQGLQGLQGPKGDQGIQGVKGADGISSYTHIAYATNSTGTTGFDTSNGAGATYIGMYVDNVATDSTDPTKYQWTLIKGADGTQGIQGPAGTNGQTPYLHIAYATSSNGSTGFDTVDATGKTFIGTYTDYTAADSTDPTKYTWALIQGPKGDTGNTGAQGPQGIQGPPGPNGQPTYTWVKYGTSASGAGMSDSPTGCTYIGLAYNKTSQTESDISSDYTWSLIQGPQGPTGSTGSQGIQGPAGPTGATLYTWLKYADSPTTGISDSPTGKKYMGIAYNKSSQTESEVYTDYTWSLIEGPQGATGPQGPTGETGSQGPTGPQGPAGTPAVNNYTWVMYGNDRTGAGITSDPTGKLWRGKAYNKAVSTPSTTASDYTWEFITDGWIKSGTVKIDGGNIYADKLSAISADLGDITGGTLNLANGKFIVDASSNVTMQGELINTAIYNGDTWSTEVSLGSLTTKNAGANNGPSAMVYVSPFSMTFSQFPDAGFVYGTETGELAVMSDQLQFRGGSNTYNGTLFFGQSTRGGTLSRLAFMNMDIDLLNNNLQNVNHITIADTGAGEGIEWIGGNGWKIHETSDDGTANNTSAPLQFFNNAGRMMTIGATGNLYNTGDSMVVQSGTGTGYFRSSATTVIFRSDTNGTYVAVTNDGSNRVYSNAIWGRTYSAGTGVGTMAITDQGTLGRLSSSIRYKVSVEDVKDDAIDKILNLNPRTWFDKTASEKFADYLTESMENPDAVLPDIGGDIRRGVGLIAEEVEALGLDEFVVYDKDENGNLQPQGLMYDRMWVYLIPVIKQQQTRIAEQDARISELEVKMNAMGGVV